MKLEKITWKLAFRNLLRHRRRTLATGLAVAAGYIGLVLLGSYIYRAELGLESSSVYLNQRGHIAIFKHDGLNYFAAKPAKYILSAEDVATLEQIFSELSSEIEFTGKYLRGAGLLDNGQRASPILISGFEPEVFDRSLSHPNMRKWAVDWIRASDVNLAKEMMANDHLVSITRSLAELIDRQVPLSDLPKEQREVSLIAKSYFGDLNAVSVDLGPVHSTGMALAEDTSLYLNLKKTQELFATDGIEYIGVYLKDSSQTHHVVKEIARMAKDKHLDVDVIPFDNEQWNLYFVGTMNFLYVMALFFIILICGAVALSIMNSTTMGILERYKEIGTLRALGFEPRQIRTFFLQENFLVTVLGITVGAVIAMGIAMIVNMLNLRFQPPGAQGDIQFMLVMHWLLCLCAMGMLFVVNLGTTAWVVGRAARRQVVQLLSDLGA